MGAVPLVGWREYRTMDRIIFLLFYCWQNDNEAECLKIIEGYSISKR